MHLPNSSHEQPAAFELRGARIDEYRLAAEMRRQMSVEHDGDFDARSEGWRERYADYFSTKQRDGRGQLFLAFDGEKAIGMAIVSFLEHYRTAVFGTKYAYVNGVFVCPEYRRRGIARKLMNMAIAWAREHGCSYLRLRSSDQGRALYASLGFTATSEMQLEL
jgi:GNAT superfamily N-acetyltransferase